MWERFNSKIEKGDGKVNDRTKGEISPGWSLKMEPKRPIKKDV